MMINIRAVVVFLMLMCASFVCDAADISSEDAAKVDIVQQMITDYMASHHTPGVAVEIFVDGKPQAYYFGYADLEKKIPVTEKTIFELGSITKVMTSILLAVNVDLAKTQLDVPVKKYLKNLSDDFDDISMQALATHTAGLPYAAPNSVTTPATLDQFLSKYYPDYVAGETWMYSNLGMGLLGEALEKLTHKNLNVLYRTELLTPLGMQPIGTEVPKSLLPNYAKGYDRNGQLVAPSHDALLISAYGVKASAGDMRQFLSAAIGLPKTPEQLFYPIRMTQATYVKLPGFSQGLGWQIYSLADGHAANLIPAPSVFDKGPIEVPSDVAQPVFNGDNLIDKTGATDGFRAYIAVIPNKKTGIVILANKNDESGDIVTVGRKILFSLNHVDAAPITPAQ